MVKSIDQSKFDVTIVSPRNHFLFTPLLPSTSTGTLDFRSIVEPIRQSNKLKTMTYFHGTATSLDPQKKMVDCLDEMSQKSFTVSYDKLVIAVGADNNTFNIPGVKEHAHFLKELHHARKIRSRIIECFEIASLPSTSVEEKRRLLHFVVVGGGPTGVEFAGELSDFFWQDLRRSFPSAPTHLVSVTLLEAQSSILTTFCQQLVDKAIVALKREGVHVRTGSQVAAVTDKTVVLTSGEVLDYGLLVWSTGVGPRPFVLNSSCLPQNNRHRIRIDRNLRVVDDLCADVYALGDCAEIDDYPLSPTAQVAQQQGKYLADSLNDEAEGKPIKPFTFHLLGLMTYVGSYKSLIDSPHMKASGFLSWIAWRSAYLTRLGSMKNKFQVPIDWYVIQSHSLNHTLSISRSFTHSQSHSLFLCL